MPLRFDNPLYEGNLLFDSPLNFPAGGQGQTITVDISENINLKWGATHELAVTTPDGVATFAGVPLIEPTGWEYVTFDGSTLDPATTESFQEYTPADLGITLAAGDLIAIQSNPAITELRTDGTFLVSPAQAIASNPYKIWDDSAGTWSALSTFSVTDEGDIVPYDGPIGFADYSMRKYARRLSFHSYQIVPEKGRWEQDQLNAGLVTLGGAAMTPPAGAPSPSTGYNGTLTYRNFMKYLAKCQALADKSKAIEAIEAALRLRGWT